MIQISSNVFPMCKYLETVWVVSISVYIQMSCHLDNKGYFSHENCIFIVLND